MPRIISPEALASLRKHYPAGCRVELVRMNDPFNVTLYEGCLGTVTGVDDIGTIHVDWDCGSSLGVAYGEDACRVIEKQEGE
jgi:hypothetical protein